MKNPNTPIDNNEYQAKNSRGSGDIFHEAKTPVKTIIDEPQHIGRKQHLRIISRTSLSQEHHRQRHGQNQQQGGSGYHHGTDPTDVLQQEHRAGHQYRDQYE